MCAAVCACKDSRGNNIKSGLRGISQRLKQAPASSSLLALKQAAQSGKVAGYIRYRKDSQREDGGV